MQRHVLPRPVMTQSRRTRAWVLAPSARALAERLLEDNSHETWHFENKENYKPKGILKKTERDTDAHGKACSDTLDGAWPTVHGCRIMSLNLSSLQSQHAARPVCDRNGSMLANTPATTPSPLPGDGQHAPHKPLPITDDPVMFFPTPTPGAVSGIAFCC